MSDDNTNYNSNNCTPGERSCSVFKCKRNGARPLTVLPVDLPTGIPTRSPSKTPTKATAETSTKDPTITPILAVTAHAVLSDYLESNLNITIPKSKPVTTCVVVEEVNVECIDANGEYEFLNPWFKGTVFFYFPGKVRFFAFLRNFE